MPCTIFKKYLNFFAGSVIGYGTGKLMGIEIIAERFVTEQPDSIITRVIKQDMSRQGYIY